MCIWFLIEFNFDLYERKPALRILLKEGGLDSNFFDWKMSALSHWRTEQTGATKRIADEDLRRSP